LVDGSNNFERFDLVITRAMHEANKANGVYERNLPDLDIYKLEIKPEGIPTYENLLSLLEKVGEKYGWDRRREFIQSPSKEQISKVIESEESRRFSFLVNGKEIGGVIIANIEPEKRLRDTFRRVSKLVPEYKDLTPEVAANTLEIYKIGLEDKFTRMRLGKFFFGELLGTLFKDDNKAGWPGNKPDAVYLNTRNTNHEGVLRFYKGFNMNVIGALTYPNDLLSKDEIEVIESDTNLKKATNTQNSLLNPAINVAAAPSL
jgi:hypothetical protein